MKELHFFKILICQYLLMTLYYFTISNIYIIIYIKCFKPYISILITFLISSIGVFMYIVLNVNTPIASIMAFSDYYEGNLTLNSIYLKAFFVFLPIILILLITNIFQVKNKDIILYEH